MKYIGMNGGIVEAAEAVIPVMDHGLLYGMGLFETFRTYEGKPFNRAALEPAHGQLQGARDRSQDGC